MFTIPLYEETLIGLFNISVTLYICTIEIYRKLFCTLNQETYEHKCNPVPLLQLLLCIVNKTYTLVFITTNPNGAFLCLC